MLLLLVVSQNTRAKPRRFFSFFRISYNWAQKRSTSMKMTRTRKKYFPRQSHIHMIIPSWKATMTSITLFGLLLGWMLGLTSVAEWRRKRRSHDWKKRLAHPPPPNGQNLLDPNLDPDPRPTTTQFQWMSHPSVAPDARRMKKASLVSLMKRARNCRIF